MRLVFYVSGHGFGHAVRSAEVLRALARRAPDLAVEVRTAAPPWLFPPGTPVTRRSLDVGVVQPESFRVEPTETLARYAAFVRAEPELVAAEAAELRAGGAGLVAADLPSAAFDVAARAGLPAVGLANFCWDWIYEPYVRAAPERAPLLDHLRAQHARADLLLRLPFHGDLGCFPRIVDIPPITRLGSADRAETRRRLGLPDDRPLVLLSFGGFSFDGLDAERLAGLPYTFVTTSPESQVPSPKRTMTWDLGLGTWDSGCGTRPRQNLVVLPRDGYAYHDLLAACDAVVAKLGYGIVADCLANRVPILYAPRGRFREEPVLARALERHGRAVRLPRAALRRWELGPHLERLLSLDRPWTDLPLDGADVAARHLLARLA